MRNPFSPYLLDKKEKKSRKRKWASSSYSFKSLQHDYTVSSDHLKRQKQKTRAFIIAQNKTSHQSLKINIKRWEISKSWWKCEKWTSLSDITNHYNLNITIELNPEHSVFLYDTRVSYLCFTELWNMFDTRMWYEVLTTIPMVFICPPAPSSILSSTTIFMKGSNPRKMPWTWRPPLSLTASVHENNRFTEETHKEDHLTGSYLFQHPLDTVIYLHSRLQSHTVELKYVDYILEVSRFHILLFFWIIFCEKIQHYTHVRASCP